jgi:peroxiredoxin
VNRLLLMLGVALPFGALHAQDSSAVKLHMTLEEGAHPGRPAPAIMLPYATADSAGPADQPFDLSKELGHVVVLVFYPGDASSRAVDDWQAFDRHEATRLARDVVFAGIASASVAAQLAFARRTASPFKFLADKDRLTIRRFGLTRAEFAVVVVGRDNRITWVDPRFAPSDSAGYVALDAAITAARKGP